MAEGHSWGIADAEVVLTDTLDRLRSSLATEVPHDRAYPKLVEDIARFTRNLLDGSPVGQ